MMQMMGSGSGQESNLLEGLIALAKDPATLAERLEALKKATELHDERKAQADKAMAEASKRTDELAALASDLAARQKKLDDLQARLNRTALDLDPGSHRALTGREKIEVAAGWLANGEFSPEAAPRRIAPVLLRQRVMDAFGFGNTEAVEALRLSIRILQKRLEAVRF